MWTYVSGGALSSCWYLGHCFVGIRSFVHAQGSFTCLDCCFLAFSCCGQLFICVDLPFPDMTQLSACCCGSSIRVVLRLPSVCLCGGKPSSARFLSSWSHVYVSTCLVIRPCCAPFRYGSMPLLSTSGGGASDAPFRCTCLLAAVMNVNHCVVRS